MIIKRNSFLKKKKKVIMVFMIWIRENFNLKIFNKIKQRSNICKKKIGWKPLYSPSNKEKYYQEIQFHSISVDSLCKEQLLLFV